MNKNFVTMDEIRNQHKIWTDTFKNYKENAEKINDFLAKIKEKHQKVRVIFTGAGTSQYVGDTLLGYLKGKTDFEFDSLATTEIVSAVDTYLKNEPTILVSFARSGNSPESVATCQKAKGKIDDLYQVVITCAKEGKLALNTENDPESLLFLINEKANDKGFAMTASFTNMVLAALLIFDDKSISEKEEIVNKLVNAAEDVIKREDEIRAISEKYDYNRVIYTGSAVFKALSQEAQLKILELTAGEIATLFDSSMGFRHGPKSFIDPKTIFFNFVSNDAYTRNYDLDILNEVRDDKIATLTMAISNTDLRMDNFKIDLDLEDVYMSIVYVIFAQLFACYTAIKLDNDVDNPSRSHTVNRVVKGVIIH